MYLFSSKMNFCSNGYLGPEPITSNVEKYALQLPIWVYAFTVSLSIKRILTKVSFKV